VAVWYWGGFVKGAVFWLIVGVVDGVMWRVGLWDGRWVFERGEYVFCGPQTRGEKLARG